jgi:RND family efflux transporter MFP subunit
MAYRFVAVVILCIACWSVSGCEQEAASFAPPPPPTVTVAQPQKSTIPVTLQYTGTTRGLTTVEVRARVRGFIEAKETEGGKRVAANDLLFRIDPRPFQAAVAEARATLADRQAKLELAEVLLQRQKDLTAGNAGSKIELDQAQANRDVAAAQVDLAKAQLQQAELDLSYTEVRAPIAGRVSVRTSEVGELVDPAAGSLLCTIIEDRRILASYNIDEAYILRLRRMNEVRRPGEDGRPLLTIEMGLGSGDEYPFRGQTYRADNTFDPSTGTIRVDAIFDNANGAIIPGMFCRIRAIFGERDAILVPDSAVLADQRGRYVLIVAGEKNLVERRDVTVGPVVERMRVIEAGLNGDERIITNGLQRARPGAPVSPEAQAAAPATAPAA